MISSLRSGGRLRGFCELGRLESLNAKMEISANTTLVSQERRLRPDQLENSVATRYKALIRVFQAIGAHRGPEELFSLLATELRQVVKFDFVGGCLYDEAANKLHWHHDNRLRERVAGLADIPLEETISWWVYQHQKAVVIPSIQQETRFPLVIELMKKWRIGSGCSLPLTTANRRLGVFFLGSDEINALSEDDISFLSLVADQIAIALENAVAYGEIREFQEKLAQEKNRLRLVIDTTPALLLSALPDGFIDFFNRRWLEYVGLPLEDVQGWGWTAAIHPEDVTGVVDKWRTAIGTGEPFEAEARVRRADGEYRWFLHRKAPLHDNLGNIVKWYGSSIDIEDRKHVEERVRIENLGLREEIDRASMFDEVIGSSRLLKTVLARVTKVAPTDCTVLLTGETGTGKELIARAIHKRSQRSVRAFVSVNCAAIPHSLMASELFGHEKGAFSGALQRRLGRFELAAGGTVFLDEIGELQTENQIALLRVLQEREFERVGGTQSIPADVRIIAATNRDLQAAIVAGTFRSDLYYRINVFPIEIPSLRDRPEDIPMLVEYFIDHYARKAGKRIRSVSRETLDLLQSYPWPGNIRELQNVIERSVIVCESENFSVDESWLSWETFPTQQRSRALSEKLATEEKAIIEAALAQTRGQVSGPRGSAAKLGMPPSTLESKIKSLKINKHRFRSA